MHAGNHDEIEGQRVADLAELRLHREACLILHGVVLEIHQGVARLILHSVMFLVLCASATFRSKELHTGFQGWIVNNAL